VVIIFDGVLGCRNHESGKFYFRDGIAEGLEMINTKIKEGGGHLGISLLVTGMTPKIFNKRLKPILFEIYKIDTLVDEIIYIDGPLTCPPTLIPSLPDDCLTFTDAINPLWVLPLGLDSTDIRDSLREKDC
jgi:hypothetical protein